MRDDPIAKVLDDLLKLDDILEWMDDYCEFKQVHSFELALADFIHEHKETRMKKARSKRLR